MIVKKDSDMIVIVANARADPEENGNMIRSDDHITEASILLKGDSHKDGEFC